MSIKNSLLTGIAALSFPIMASSQLFVTDVIVQGSLCVGIDCVNSESFGFDTERLKENNLRIHFDDTSNSASFPANDWRITINDSDNGGESYFGIDDATAGTRPLKVEAGSGNNALVIESGAGDIGMGTADPAVELHIADGDSPALRLEQNGSGGWTPQTWDIAGNETNFFIRDVTNGSKLPFKIKPGAPDNSVFINGNGNVTIGDDNSVEKLYVNGNIATNGDVHFRHETNDIFKVAFDEVKSTFNIEDAQSGSKIVVINEDSPENTLYIHDSGSISIGSNVENRKLYINGGLTVNGDIYCLSDKRIKSNVQNIQYGLSDVMKLSAKQYDFDNTAYKNLTLAKGLQLGLIAQDVEKVIPEIVVNNINTDANLQNNEQLKGVNYTALVPVLVKAIQEQQTLIETKNKELADVKNQLAELSKKVDQLINTSNKPSQNSENRNLYQDDPSAEPIIKSSEEQVGQPLNNGRSKGN